MLGGVAVGVAGKGALSPPGGVAGVGDGVVGRGVLVGVVAGGEGVAVIVGVILGAQGVTGSWGRSRVHAAPAKSITRRIRTRPESRACRRMSVSPLTCKRACGTPDGSARDNNFCCLCCLAMATRQIRLHSTISQERGAKARQCGADGSNGGLLLAGSV